jgi:hypothetical protein
VPDPSHGVGAGLLRGSFVLADQPAEDRPTSDPLAGQINVSARAGIVFRSNSARWPKSSMSVVASPADPQGPASRLAPDRQPSARDHGVPLQGVDPPTRTRTSRRVDAYREVGETPRWAATTSIARLRSLVQTWRKECCQRAGRRGLSAASSSGVPAAQVQGAATRRARTQRMW